MEYLTQEWLRGWISSHCADNPSREEIDRAFENARFEAEKVLAKLDKMEISVKPIIFDSRDFPNMLAFNVGMDIVGKRFKNEEKIHVKYVKPEYEKTKDVFFQFHIVLEKEKKNKS